MVGDAGVQAIIVKKTLDIPMLTVADDKKPVIPTEGVQQLGCPLVYLSVTVGKQHEFLTHSFLSDGRAGPLFEFGENTP
jgi:hypothetical protein